MVTTLVLALGVLILLGLIAARVPVGFALLAAGTVGLMVFSGTAETASQLATRPFGAVASYSLVLIPMFMLMSMFVVQARVAEDVFQVAGHALRRLPGGLGLATLSGCAGFAAVTGSSVATVATMGRVSMDEMRKAGYSPAFAGGLVAASGTLGILIPPSIVLVVYGILAQVSIGDLFLAGVVPGIISAIMYGVVIVLWARKGGVSASLPTPDAETAEAAEGRLRIFGRGTIALLEIGALFLIIIVGIYSGVFTATESGAVAASVALIMFLVLHRGSLRQKWNDLVTALVETATVSAMVFLLLIGGSMFTLFLLVMGVPAQLASWLVGLDMPPLLIVIMLLAALVPLGMVLDGFSILLITVPLMAPTVIELGFDGVWFGVLMVMLIEIGLLTPPVGINVFVAAGIVPWLSVESAFRGVVPFLGALVLDVALILAFPQIALWLPSLGS